MTDDEERRSPPPPPIPGDALLAHALEPLVVLEPDATIRYANPAADSALGGRPRSLVGRSLLELVHPDDRCEVDAALARARAGDPARVAFRGEREGGAWPVLEAVLRGTTDPAGRTFVVVATRDVTERESLAERLRRAQRLATVAQAACAYAHDFRNLLLIITASTAFARRALFEGGSPEADLDAIDGAVARAVRLAEQLQAAHGAQHAEPRPIELGALVRDIEPLLRRLVHDRIEIVTRIAPGLRPVRAELGPLEQVIVNLAANARDAMPAGGVLTIEAANVTLAPDDEGEPRTGTRPGAYVCLRVRDTGIGMDAATRARAFEPYFTTKRGRGGTGLGLATARDIVERMGGSIAIASEPGRGTIVELFLPAAGDPARDDRRRDGSAGEDG